MANHRPNPFLALLRYFLRLDLKFLQFRLAYGMFRAYIAVGVSHEYILAKKGLSARRIRTTAKACMSSSASVRKNFSKAATSALARSVFAAYVARFSCPAMNPFFAS